MANSNRAVVIAIDNDAVAESQAPEERRQAVRMVEALLFASAEPRSGGGRGGSNAPDPARARQGRRRPARSIQSIE